MIWPIIWGASVPWRDHVMSHTAGESTERRKSLQLGVLRLGLLQDGDVVVGVFPEGEEILIAGFRFGGVAGECIGPSETEMGKRAEREVQHQAAMVEEVLEFDGSCVAVVCEKISLSAKVSGV